MLCLGTVSGYYGNRIRQLARERHGLEELGESWSGVSVRNYIDHPDFRSRPKRSAWQEWLEWPLGFFTKPLQNRIHAYHSKEHVKSLSLFASETIPRSMKGIEKLQQLQNLRFQYSAGVGSRIFLDGAEFRRIAKLKNLRNLSLSHCYTDTEAFEILANLNLRTLTCGGSVKEVELEHISQAQSLEELTIWNSIANLEALPALTNLRQLSIRVDTLTDLEPLAQMQPLTHLVVSGDVAMKQLETLQRVPNLKSIVLGSGWKPGWKPAMTDMLLDFPSLDKVKFGRSALTKTGFEKLVAAGIEVDHGGLVDFRPTENYLKYESLYFELDLARSEILGEIQIGKPEIDWRISVQANDRYAPTVFSPPNFSSGPFSRAGDWRGLVGFKQASWKLQESSNLNMSGKDVETSENSVEIHSRNGSHFRLKSGFASMREEGFGRIEAELCLRRVIVKSERPISRDEATLELAEHFATQDFDLTQQTTGKPLRREHEFKLIVEP